MKKKSLFLSLLSLFVFTLIFFMNDVGADSSASSSISDFPVNVDSGADAIGGSPSIAYDGENFLTVWAKDSNIYCARTSREGVVLDPDGIVVSVGYNENANYRQPSVGFDGTNYFVVWVATRSGENDIYGCRVTKYGQILDPEGIRITYAGNVYIKPVGIAFDGSNYLLVWRTTASMVMGVRMNPSGIALDNQVGFKIADNGYYPSVAYDNVDDVFMAVWHQGDFGSLTVWGALIDTEGELLSPDNFLICNDPQDKENARIAFGGTNFMVIWYDWRPNSDQLIGSCYGTRVTAQGAVLDKPAFKIAERVRGEIFPNIVFDGTDFVAVWSTDSFAANKFRLSDVYATRITTAGLVLDRQAIPVSTAFEHQFGPSIGFGGDKYLVVWNDKRLVRNGGDPALFARIFDKGFNSRQAPFENQSEPEVDWTAKNIGGLSGAYYGTSFNDDEAFLFSNVSHFNYDNGIWNDMGTMSFQTIFAGCQINDGRFLLGGWAGCIVFYNGSTWEDRFGWVPGNSFITGLWNADENHIWASLSSVNGFAYYNGNRWDFIHPDFPPVDIEDIAGISGSNIYAVGEKGVVLHFNGTAWSPVPDIPTVQTLNAVWINTPNDIFAVGDFGTILHFNGIGWNIQTTCTNSDLKDIWGFGGSDVYAAGFNGTILHYDGNKWNRENSGSDEDFLTVFGGFNGTNGTGTVWVAGTGSDVLQKTRAVIQPETPAPEGLAVISSGTANVVLSWAVPEDVSLTGFRLEYRTAGAFSWTGIDLNIISTYTISGLDNTKTYDFRIKAEYHYVFQSAYSSVLSGRFLKQTVAFNSLGGTNIGSKTTGYNTPITPPVAPVRSGYVFLGWYKEITCANAWNFTTDIVTSNITLYAKWSVNSFVVTFINWDGSILKSQTVNYGGAATAPSIPARTGYTFIGWNKNFNNITSNITVSANFTINIYTITFNSNGGSAVASKTATYDSLLTAPVSPTKKGYKFVGWYFDQTCTSPWLFATYKVAANRTLYAKWLANQVSGLRVMSNTYNSLKLTWNVTTGANYYQIYRATGSSGTYTLIATQLYTSASYINTGLTTGMTYYYKVRAYALYAGNNIYSDFSSAVYNKVVPAAPLDFKAVSSSYNSIRLTWTAVTGANGYYIYRAASSTGTFVMINNSIANSYTNTGLATGTTYYYKVYSYRLAGTNRIYSGPSSVATAKPVPAAVGSFSVIRYNSTSIKISWAAVSGASGYEVHRSISSAGTYANIKSTTSISYINTGLITGKYYYYKIRAYRLVGTVRVYSNFSAVKYAKT